MSHLAELDDIKHILAACEGLAPFVAGLVRDLTSGSDFPSRCPANEPPVCLLYT